jgi:hypothetical protein
VRVLVCGGRKYSDADTISKVLSQYPITFLINGGCKPRWINGKKCSADFLAVEWAMKHNPPIPPITFDADWDKYGKKAGPIRNRKMMREGKPDLVIAFPGGSGTADMVSVARAAGVPVVEVDAELTTRSGVGA